MNSIYYSTIDSYMIVGGTMVLHTFGVQVGPKDAARLKLGIEGAPGARLTFKGSFKGDIGPYIGSILCI